jgi:hypothetical protein
MRFKTEDQHRLCAELTEQFLRDGGTIAKISPSGRISMTCTNCGRKRTINARDAVLFGPARCWCGGQMQPAN